MEAPTHGTGQQPMGEPTVKERKGVRRQSSQEKPICTDHNPIPDGTREGRRIRGAVQLSKWRQRCSYLSLLPTTWRNSWISILIGSKLIFFKSTLSCPQQQPVISLSLSQLRSFLNPFLLCKGWMSGWEGAWQLAKGNPLRPTQPPQKHTWFVKLYDFASPLYITELQHNF